jgi:hypothetical protein
MSFRVSDRIKRAFGTVVKEFKDIRVEKIEDDVECGSSSLDHFGDEMANFQSVHSHNSADSIPKDYYNSQFNSSKDDDCKENNQFASNRQYPLKEHKNEPSMKSSSWKLFGSAESKDESSKSPPRFKPVFVEQDDEDDDLNEVDSQNVKKMFSKVRHNHIKYVEKALIDNFDVFTVDQFGNTLLHVCAQNNHIKLANVIIQAGCPINARNYKGMTPKDYCVMYKFTEMEEWLSKMNRNGTNNNFTL